MNQTIKHYGELVTVPILGIGEQLVTLFGDIVMGALRPFSGSRYRTWKAWKFRRHAEDTAAAIEAIERHPKVFGGFVDMRHPGNLEEKKAALDAEKAYYERRAEILEQPNRNEHE